MSVDLWKQVTELDQKLRLLCLNFVTVWQQVRLKELAGLNEYFAFLEAVVSEHSEDVDSGRVLCFLRTWSVRLVVFLLYFNIIWPGHNLHTALVLSTRLFSISLWPSMCSVQQVVSLSMSTKYLCLLGRFLHVTYLYRDIITYCILILSEERICVHFHVMRA